MPLRISDITPFTTIDFPGRLACVLWCRGCPLDCAYCHNPDLRAPCSAASDLPWDRVMDFLARRYGILDGVVLSGGEPLMQGALPEAMGQIRALGYALALHTAGTSPARLERVLSLCDWVGFDVKAPFDRYPSITGVERSGEKARASLRLLLASGVAYEVRTTVDPDLLSDDDILALAETLAFLRVKTFRIQEVSGIREPLAEALMDRIAPLFADFAIRRATPGHRAMPAPAHAEGQCLPSAAKAV